jgi:hypothetical protein
VKRFLDLRGKGLVRRRGETMKTKKIKKLQLNRESLRMLEQSLLKDVAGGATRICTQAEISTCPNVFTCLC